MSACDASSPRTVCGTCSARRKLSPYCESACLVARSRSLPRGGGGGSGADTPARTMAGGAPAAAEDRSSIDERSEGLEDDRERYGDDTIMNAHAHVAPPPSEIALVAAREIARIAHFRRSSRSLAADDITVMVVDIHPHINAGGGKAKGPSVTVP